MRKIGTQRQLLLDEFIVEDLWALKRTLHQPTKHPQNPLMVKEHEWEGQGPYLYGTVLFDLFFKKVLDNFILKEYI